MPGQRFQRGRCWPCRAIRPSRSTASRMVRAVERSDRPGSLPARGAPGDYEAVARSLVKDGFAVLPERALALQANRIFAAGHDFFELEHDAKLAHSTPAPFE